MSHDIVLIPHDQIETVEVILGSPKITGSFNLVVCCMENEEDGSVDIKVLMPHGVTAAGTKALLNYIGLFISNIEVKPADDSADAEQPTN